MRRLQPLNEDEKLAREKAWKAVCNAITAGKLSRISTQFCTDCGNQADHYDHFNGYSEEMRLVVQPVCISCDMKRRRVRGELPSISSKIRRIGIYRGVLQIGPKLKTRHFRSWAARTGRLPA